MAMGQVTLVDRDVFLTSEVHMDHDFPKLHLELWLIPWVHVAEQIPQLVGVLRRAF